MWGLSKDNIDNELKCNILIIIIMKYRCFYTLCIDRQSRNIGHFLFIFFYFTLIIFDQCILYLFKFIRYIIAYRELEKEEIELAR